MSGNSVRRQGNAWGRWCGVELRPGHVACRGTAVRTRRVSDDGVVGVSRRLPAPASRHVQLPVLFGAPPVLPCNSPPPVRPPTTPACPRPAPPRCSSPLRTATWRWCGCWWGRGRTRGLQTRCGVGRIGGKGLCEWVGGWVGGGGVGRQVASCGQGRRGSSPACRRRAAVASSGNGRQAVAGGRVLTRHSVHHQRCNTECSCSLPPVGARLNRSELLQCRDLTASRPQSRAPNMLVAFVWTGQYHTPVSAGLLTKQEAGGTLLLLRLQL